MRVVHTVMVATGIDMYVVTLVVDAAGSETGVGDPCTAESTDRAAGRSVPFRSWVECG